MKKSNETKLKLKPRTKISLVVELVCKVSCCRLFEGEPVPGPLPLGVAVIDSSVRLYGLVFPHVAHKHRLQMLEHFGECIKQAKASRQQAIQINIFTAVLYALKVNYWLLLGPLAFINSK